MTMQTEQVHPILLDVKAVAQSLGCSPRHVLRMVEAGNFPAPVRLGRLIRWPKSTLESWIGQQSQS